MNMRNVDFNTLRTLSNIPYELPYDCTNNDALMYLNTYKKVLTLDVIKDYLNSIDTISRHSNIDVINLPSSIFSTEKIVLMPHDLIEFYTLHSNYDLVTRILNTVCHTLILTLDDVKTVFREILMGDSSRLNQATYGIMLLLDKGCKIHLDIDFINELLDHAAKISKPTTFSNQAIAINFINSVSGEMLLDARKEDIFDTEAFKVYKRDSTIDEILEQC